MKTPEQLLEHAVARLNDRKEDEVQRTVDEIVGAIAKAQNSKRVAIEKADKEIAELQKELREVTLTEISRQDLGL